MFVHTGHKRIAHKRIISEKKFSREAFAQNLRDLIISPLSVAADTASNAET